MAPKNPSEISEKPLDPNASDAVKSVKLPWERKEPIIKGTQAELDNEFIQNSANLAKSMIEYVHAMEQQGKLDHIRKTAQSVLTTRTASQASINELKQLTRDIYTDNFQKLTLIDQGRVLYAIFGKEFTKLITLLITGGDITIYPEGSQEPLSFRQLLSHAWSTKYPTGNSINLGDLSEKNISEK